MQICLVMDEVDGMSGGDRGGVGELINIIKASKVPIICICNDNYNQKLKSLRNSCLELGFRWDTLDPPTTPEAPRVPRGRKFARNTRKMFIQLRKLAVV